MAVLLTSENVTSFAKQFNNSVTGSEIRVDGCFFLSKLSKIPEFMFYVELLNQYKSTATDRLIKVATEVADANVIKSSEIRGEIKAISMMLNLLSDAEIQLKKASERSKEREIIHASK